LRRSLPPSRRECSYSAAKEVAALIWEADGDNDGKLSLADFERMYLRAKTDRSGHEPKGMYNITQFLLMNSSGSGTVTADEWMHFVIQKYSRGTLDSILKATETPQPFTLPEYMANIKKVARLMAAKAPSKPSTRGSRTATKWPASAKATQKSADAR
jgi:hypothetical protein